MSDQTERAPATPHSPPQTDATVIGAPSASNGHPPVAAAAVRWLNRLLLISALIALVLIEPLAARPLETLGFIVLVALASIASSVLLRSGRTVTAAWTALGAWWIVGIVPVLLGGGIDARNLHGIIVAALATWIVFGRRYLWFSAGLAIAVGFGLLVLHLTDRTPPVYFPLPAPAAWAHFTLSIIMIALLSSRSLDEEQRTLRELRSQLVARREADLRFRAIFDQTFQFIGLLSADGTLLEANRAALSFANARLDDVVGRPFWDTPWWSHSKEQQQILKQAIQDAARGKFIRFHTSHPAADGTPRAVDFSLKPVRDESGQVVLLIPEGRDVTESDRAQAAFDALMGLCAMTTGPTFFESVAERLRACCGVDYAIISEIDILDPRFARSVAISSAGRTPPPMSFPLAGTPCDDTIHHAICFHQSAVAKRYPDDPILRDLNVESYMGVRLASSSDRVLGTIELLSSRPIPDPALAERFLRAVAARTGAELERAQAERSLRESQARLAAVISNSPGVAVQWYDQHGRIVLWNKTSELMFGFAEPDALGRTLADLIFSKDEADEFFAALRSIAESGEPIGPSEFPFRRKDGSMGLCLSTIFRIPGVGGSHWFVCMDVDVTKLRETEQALQQSQKLQAIGQLAGGVAHDFNNILTVVNGYSDALLTQIPASMHDARTAAIAIREAGERASLLTRQLLAFSRRQRVEPRVIDINAELVELQPMISRLLGSHIRVLCQPAAGHALFRIDEAHFQQVILNLAVNARDAMPDGGSLTMRTENVPARTEPPAPPSVRLIVSDQGIGMTPAVRERLFEPFFTTKGPGKGTGLGLATVYGIVKQSAGEISVDSAEGKGTSFTITWPAASADPPEPIPARDNSDPRGNECILLVEDDPAVRAFVASTLRSRGYAIVEAASGDDALVVANAYRDSVRLLLTDLMMPGIDGRALAERVRSIIPHLPVILVSGQAGDESVLDTAITDDFVLLSKPLDAHVLARQVRALLDARSVTTELKPPLAGRAQQHPPR
jgi:PAS domain S-box-containing protein